MNNDSVINNTIKQIKDLGVETGKEFVKAAGQITKGISAGELLGDIKPLSDEELKKKKEEEEKMKARLKGNNLDDQVKELREKKSADAKAMADKVEMEEKRRKEEEQRQAEMYIEMPGNPSKAKKKRGSAFVPADKKSQTAEYSKKPD